MHETSPDSQYSQPTVEEFEIAGVDLTETNELLLGQTVMLGRIYDLLAVIARASNVAEAEKVLSAHEAGGLIGSPPNLTEWS